MRRTQEVILAGSILLIATLTILNVFTRSVLGMSLAFTEELSQLFMVVITFVGLGYAASQGRHIRMTALYDQLGHRSRKILMVAITAGTSALTLGLAYFSLRYVGTVHALGTVSPALQIPLYAVYLVAPLGLGMASIQYAMAAYRNLSVHDIHVSYSQKEGPDEGGQDPGL